MDVTSMSLYPNVCLCIGKRMYNLYLMIRIFLVTLFFAFCFMQGLSAQHCLWVGQSFECDGTSAMMGLTSDKSWSVSGGYISQNAIGSYNKITVTQYFSGTATVTFSWKERLTPRDQWRSRSKSWMFTCQDNPLNMSPNRMTLAVGETAYVSFGHTYQNQYSSYDTPYVQSKNPNVAKVDRWTGEIIAVGPGTAEIFANSKLSSNSPYCIVTVKKVDPTSVSIPSTLLTYVGESADISAKFTPSNAQTTLTWYSQNSSVASVSSGTVAGKAEGTTYVYATTSNGLRSNDCEIIVKYRKATNVSMSQNTLYLPIGHNKKLSAQVSPSNAKYTLEWLSDNEDVAKVSSDGIVTAKKHGTARIKVITDNGYSATCVVTVPPMPETISIPSKIALRYGKSITLKCSVQPADAYLSLTWQSSNTDVARVNQNGEITACGAGESVITVKAEGGKETTCKVLVEEPKHCFVVWTIDGKRVNYLMKDHPVVTHEGGKLVLTTRKLRVETPESQIRKYTFEDQTTDPYPYSIEMESTLTIPYKQTKQLEYKLLPADFDIETNLVWNSSAPHIVSVDQTGRILARCNGEAVITLTASNGTNASCLVTVTDVQIYLVVWTQDGGKALYPINEQPTIKYDNNGNYIVRSSTMEVQYPLADVRMFMLSDTDNPLPDQPMDILEVFDEHGFIYSDDKLSFSSLRPGSMVRIYNASGMLLRSFEVAPNGSLSVSIDDLPNGVSIIKSESITHKIIKK